MWLVVSLCHSHFLKWHVKCLIIQANIEYMTWLVYIEFELFTYWFIQMESESFRLEKTSKIIKSNL